MYSNFKRIPYLCVYKLHFFDKNWGVAYTRNLKKTLDPQRKSCYLIDNWAHDAGIVCCETPSRDRKNQHHWLSIDSHKLEDRDITDKLP
jgi:hypothetical protein